MKSAVVALLGMVLAFTVSCSNGSSSGGGNGGGLGGGNAQGQGSPALGQWQGVNNGDAFTLVITASSMQLTYQCMGQTHQGTVAVTLTATTIDIQENKVIGTGQQCQNTFQQGGKIPYRVQGNSLELTVDAGVIQATRFGGDQNPQNPQDPQNPGQGGGLQIQLFAGANCTGESVEYTYNMNCNQLNGQVNSLHTGQGCTNTNQTLTAKSVCESLNQQIGQGG